MAAEQSSTGSDTGPLTAKCHCGRVQLQLPSKPSKINECQCTVCYKYGALWGYFQRNEVTITVDDNTTLTDYIRSDADGSISFRRCGNCGCMVAWTGVGEYSGPEHKMGVNCRMLHMTDIESCHREISAGPER